MLFRSALVEAHFARHHVQPQPNDVRFWLRESRSPEILRQCAAAYPDLCGALSADRPLLELVPTAGGDDAALERALMEEELAERARDREYWRPLRAELERLRHQRA